MSQRDLPVVTQIFDDHCADLQAQSDYFVEATRTASAADTAAASNVHSEMSDDARGDFITRLEPYIPKKRRNKAWLSMVTEFMFICHDLPQPDASSK